MKLDTIRVFAISRLRWIRQQQQKLRGQERETPREYLERESHYVWGTRYLLKLVEARERAGVQLTPRTMILRIGPGASAQDKADVLARWYREQIREAVPGVIAKWGPIMGVSVRRIFVQKMKTKWGSCNTRAGSIRLNTDLAKKPRECLEYIVVHEMAHLLECNHNARFFALMDRFLPQWQAVRDELNRAPLSHQDWAY
jgi:predicted metal-dependent hydrolase